MKHEDFGPFKVIKMEWITADDKSRVPKRDMEVLLCVLPRQKDLDEGSGEDFPWIMTGSIKVFGDGDYGFIADDDPSWGNYTAYWMPLPSVPVDLKGLTYEMWSKKRKNGLCSAGSLNA